MATAFMLQKCPGVLDNNATLHTLLGILHVHSLIVRRMWVDEDFAADGAGRPAMVLEVMF